jgi:hypothetical protein
LICAFRYHHTAENQFPDQELVSVTNFPFRVCLLRKNIPYREKILWNEYQILTKKGQKVKNEISLRKPDGQQTAKEDGLIFLNISVPLSPRVLHFSISDCMVSRNTFFSEGREWENN